MAKVILSTYDPFIIMVRDKKESADMFGEDYILERGVNIPDDLLQRYQKNYAEFWAIQKELDSIEKEKNI